MLKNQKGISLVILIFIVVLLVIITGVIVMFSINKSDENIETKTSSNQENISKNNNMIANSTNINNQTSNNTKSVKTAQVPGMQIYVDYDSSLRKHEESYAVLMTDGKMDSAIGLAYDIYNTFSGNLEDVVNIFKFHFISAFSLHSGTDLYGTEFTVKSTEKVKIANRDSIRFEASVLSKDNKECYLYGYTFLIDGIPCAVIGITVDQSMISEINTSIDEAASTIRTTK